MSRCVFEVIQFVLQGNCATFVIRARSVRTLGCNTHDEATHSSRIDDGLPFHRRESIGSSVLEVTGVAEKQKGAGTAGIHQCR